MSNQASNHTVPIVERPNDRASSLPRAVDPLGTSYPLPDVPGPVDDYPTDGTGVQYQCPMDTFTCGSTSYGCAQRAPMLQRRFSLRGGADNKESLRFPKYMHTSAAEFREYETNLMSHLRLSSKANALDHLLKTGNLHPKVLRSITADVKRELGSV